MATKKKSKAGKPAKQSKTDRLRATREVQASKPRRAEKRQPEIPGFERPVDPELEPLCASFLEQSDAWAQAQKEANEIKDKIAELMSGKNILKYAFRDGERSHDFLFGKAKLRVVKVKPQETEVGAS